MGIGSRSCVLESCYGSAGTRVKGHIFTDAEKSQRCFSCLEVLLVYRCFHVPPTAKGIGRALKQTMLSKWPSSCCTNGRGAVY